jgi:hypothetical protein
MKHRATLLLETIAILPAFVVLIAAIAGTLLMSEYVVSKHSSDLYAEKARKEILAELYSGKAAQDIRISVPKCSINRIESTGDLVKVFISYEELGRGKESYVLWPNYEKPSK